MPRITEMYAFVSEVESPDDEVIVGMMVGDEWFPMVCTDMAQVEWWRPRAQVIATKAGKRIKILKFSNREEIGEVVPL